ncbi:hypothetical protein [Zophobihabitans entericus]|uniref:Uncharacterized protein n=1 Tax=Zophobihabitans entericus TaxID=1635327 RepID=A0A6G9ICB2_9GAMM|nr:hypothetical protein [Zophobihabitans entericus]QIQ21477.1 hypothetical protein IPMB12_07135 [Zophobihabitans entericus]
MDNGMTSRLDNPSCLIINFSNITNSDDAFQLNLTAKRTKENLETGLEALSTILKITPSDEEVVAEHIMFMMQDIKSLIQGINNNILSTSTVAKKVKNTQIYIKRSS